MGNLDSRSDRGHARDYVEMQWRMLQQEQPEDFMIATGRQLLVRRFIELATSELGLGGIEWQGEGLCQTGLRAETGITVVRIDPRYFRPAEVEILLGDPTKAREEPDWTPATTLEELVVEMVAADRRRREERVLPQIQGLPGGGLDGKSVHQPRGDRGGGQKA
jgi:GDPmannose 4,6-dehydratase